MGLAMVPVTALFTPVFLASLAATGLAALAGGWLAQRRRAA
jgi:hypothetical protein